MDLRSCDFSQVGIRATKYFFLISLSKSELITLKLYHKVPYPQRKVGIHFLYYDKKHLGIMGKNFYYFNSGQILIVCQISNQNKNSKLYHVWMMPIFAPTDHGLTFSYLSSCSLWSILFYHIECKVTPCKPIFSLEHTFGLISALMTCDGKKSLKICQITV